MPKRQHSTRSGMKPPAITVCNNCGLQREGRHQTACPACDASYARQSWVSREQMMDLLKEWALLEEREEPPSSKPVTKAPELPNPILKLLENYKDLEKLRSI